jgi:hypothetical protein
MSSDSHRQAESALPPPITIPATRRGQQLLVWSTGIAWMIAVVGGQASGVFFELTAAPAHRIVSDWPAEAACHRAVDRPTLVMFIHPKCPCTRASLEEAANLHRRCGDQLAMQFVFLEPLDAPWKSDATEHWQSVRELQAGSMMIDPGGSEHRRFGATTSGEVFLFDRNGQLAFHGGVTAGRGHIGESPGRRAIESLVLSSEATFQQSPVYGCSLDTPCHTARTLPRELPLR